MKPMLAKDGDLAKLAWPQIAQPKLDGIRCVITEDGPLSRTLKPIPNESIRAALSDPSLVGMDGELIVGHPEAADCYRRTSSFVMSQSKTGEPWAFHVFDVWDKPERPYSIRVSTLADRIERLTWTDLPIFLVPSQPIANHAELDAYEAAMLALGHEGLILRDPAGQYKYGRSGKTGPLLKVKRFVDFEAEVVGVYEEQHNGNVAKTNALGRTERSSAAAGKVGKGTLGGLVLRALNGPSEGIEFRCGTGFDAQQRADLWRVWTTHSEHYSENPLFLKVAKIKSFPIGVKEKPRHPVFLGWRDMEVDG